MGNRASAQSTEVGSEFCSHRRESGLQRKLRREFFRAGRRPAGALLVTFPYHISSSTDRRDGISPGPEVLAHEIALPLAINTGQMDGALAFDIAIHQEAGGRGQSKNRKRWSVRSMGRHAGVSHSTVQRIWSKNGLKPHVVKKFKLSNDPEF